MKDKIYDGIKVLAIIAILISAMSLVNYIKEYNMLIMQNLNNFDIPEHLQNYFKDSYYFNFYMQIISLALTIIFMIVAIGILKLNKICMYLMIVVPILFIASYIFTIIYTNVLVSRFPLYLDKDRFLINPFITIYLVYIWYFLRKDVRKIFSKKV